ncbi:MAG: hypothetical protein U1E21_18380 [Reyranellaceae bacterium]
MRPYTRGRELVLAFQPSSRGLAYVLFEGPLSPLAWEMKDIRGPRRLSQSFQAAVDLIARYEPDVLVIEDKLASPNDQLRTRKRFQRMIGTYAEGRALDVYAYSRADVRACFADAGAITRREIAQVIAGQIHALHRLPPKRAWWKAEHRRLFLFDAAALALTYFSRDANFRLCP